MHCTTLLLFKKPAIVYIALGSSNNSLAYACFAGQPAFARTYGEIGLGIYKFFAPPENPTPTS